MRQPSPAGLALLATLVLAPIPLPAAEATPDAATLLFEENQLAQSPPGTILAYAYSRKTTDDAKYGHSFDDRVRLTLEAGAKPDERTVEVELFTGQNKRPAGPFPDMTGNPILSLFLENHVLALAKQLEANPRYLKNAIRAGLRDKAEVSQAPIEMGGRTVPGWHVRIAPFRDDPNKARMLGLDGLVYDFLVAKDVPGEIVEISIKAPASGAPLFEERIAYDAGAH
jgi:hypothetical protein